MPSKKKGFSDDPVTITGIGGRYPESKNVDEFWNNLLSGRELCVEDDSRWPIGYMRLPAKAGKIPNIDRFDSTFFGIPDKQANELDPQFKICHETTFEAIIDAGLDPVDLRGSRTGMFIGYCYSDSSSAQLQVDATLYNSQWTEGFSEVSKNFGFKGPCLTYDSACASSFSAFNEAVHCINAGVIDTAIVAGVSVSTSPVTAQGFRQLGMTSIEGQCRCMDKKANGYVRSETIASIVLQRKSASKRIYSIVLNSITNSDGYKKEGITFPGMESMIKLMRTAYEEINLDPKDTKYIEAHVTGTKAGDPVECKAIEDVFCPEDRTDPVLLGCLKSNMGHPEGASGVAALTKSSLILQKKVIPPNINYKEANPNIPGLFNGKLKPVLQVTPFEDANIISVNSFGFGGSNIHTIIQSYDERINDNVHNITNEKHGLNRLILFKSRTEEAFETLKEKLVNCKELITNESLAFIDNIATLTLDATLFPFRGYFIINREKEMVSWDLEKYEDDENSKLASASYLDANNKKKNASVVIKIAGNKNTKLASQLPNWVQNFLSVLQDANIKFDIFFNVNHGRDDRMKKSIVMKINLDDKKDDADLIEDAESDTNMSVFNISRKTTKDEILKMMGTLYMTGNDDIRILNLYQRVSYPVSSATMSISPLISWDHENQWTVYKVPDYFRFTTKNKRLYFDYSTTYNYLTGHVIDGRIIFPAAQYLWSIWQSLAMELCDRTQEMAFLSTGIKFQDVSLHRAIIVDRNDEVIITTRVNPFTGFFEIIQDDACLVSGHAMLTYDQGVPTLQAEKGEATQDIQEKEMISKHDFYKELRVRGYDYEDDFQGVSTCNIDGTGGTVAFLKNWVTFCDAVFQLTLINDVTRQLFLPTGFNTLQIDAKVFKNISKSQFEIYEKLLNADAGMDANENTDAGAKENEEDFSVKEESKEDAKDETPIFTVKIIKETLEVFTDGLYIKGMKESPVPRKKIAPTLLKFEYHPFDETVYEDVNERNAKHEYVECCLNLIKHVPENIDANNNIDANTDANKVAVKDEETPTDEKSLLAVLKNIKTENKDVTKEELSKYSNQLKNDILVQTPIMTDAIKHQLDIVTNTFHGQTLRVTEVNLSSKESIKEPVEETLKMSCPGTSYTLIEDADANGDAKVSVRSVDDHLSVKSLESELVLIQHPSLGFNFVDSADTLKERVSKYQKVLRTSFDQLISGNFMILMARNEMNMIEKSLDTSHDYSSTFNIDNMISDIKNIGYIIVSIKKVVGSNNFVSILSRKPIIDVKPEIFNIDTYQYDWVNEVRSKTYIEDGEGDNITRRPNSNVPIFLVSKNDEISGISGFISCIRNEDKRFHGICILDKHADAKYHGDATIHRDANKDAKEEEYAIMSEAIKLSLPMITYKDGSFGSLMASKLSTDETVSVLPSADSDEKIEVASQTSDGHDSGFQDEKNENISFVLDVETKGDLTSLKYHEVTLNNNNLESIVDVHYSALNFKDVMVASGRVPPTAYPASLRPLNAGEMGMEFSGTDAKGQRVMGLVPTDAIATKIDVGKASDFLFQVPKGMSLEEAATIPVVYSTVFYALIMRGKLLPGESILIHAGSGGVGQAAINVCQSMGCEVYTTVGTQEKREFIKSQFNIPDDHIFDSRSTRFADDILRATDGNGVDVVLNSLSEEKLRVGLTCLATNGRFIEIGKYDMITNSSFDPSCLSMNQTFQSVCLAFFMAKVAANNGNDPEVKQLRSLMEKGIKDGVVRPLSRKIFEWNQTEEAFRFMASGKHIGKILIKMKDEDDAKDGHSTRTEDAIRGVRKRISFDSNKSFIVVGGLGGMGLEICFWLVKKGARNLIITSRSGIKTVYEKFCILRLEAFGAKVVVSKLDVSKYEEAKELIKLASTMAPLAGIFNLGMVLKDALFENQDKDLFEECCSIKIKGSSNLDTLTRIMCPELEHFVCFSSLVSTIGNAGQCNYGFANSFMDNLCTKRRNEGFPGLAMGWGAIGDVGHVAEHMGNDVIIAGSVPQRINSCFDVLEKVLFGSNSIIGSFIPADRSSFDTKGDLLASILNVLGIKDHSKVDPKSSLGDLGLDSLMAVEIKQILEKKYDKVMSTKEIRELKIEEIKQMNENIKK